MYHSHRFPQRTAQSFALPRSAGRSAPPAVPGVWPLCRDAAATLSANCVPLMALGLTGFASVPAFAAFITLALSLAGALGNGAALGQFDRLPNGLACAYTLVFVIAGALTRGAITWRALHPHATMKDAWRAAGVRWPALLLVSFGHLLCMALGVAGLAVWLRAWRIDSDLMVQPPATSAAMQRAVLGQMADALLPDPILPHSAVFPRLRSFAFGATVQADLLRRLRSAALKDSVVIGVPLNYAPATSAFTLIPVIGLVVIVASETLWRSRVVMVMCAAPRESIQPMARTLRFGALHFGPLMARVWALRVIVATVCIAGVVLPCVLVCSQVAPALARSLHAPAVLPLCAFTVSAGAAVAGALLVAFETIFDVKLVSVLEANNKA